MKQLFIKTSYQCNNACVFCFNKGRKRSEKFLLKDLVRQIKVFASEGGERLTVSGGEPLISKHLFKLLAIARQEGIKFLEIQTNGRMLSDKNTVARLKKFEPISFLVSFHFPNNKLYQKYSGSNGFNQVVQGIKNLVKYDCAFTVTTVVMRPNLIHLEEIIKTLKDIGVKKYQYKFIDGLKILDTYKEFVPRYRECMPIIKKIINENPDIDIDLKRFPPCVVGKGLKDNVSPILIPEKLILTNWGQEMLAEKNINKKKSVFPNCRKCTLLSSCQGMAKEYAQIYGIKEFKPL